MKQFPSDASLPKSEHSGDPLHGGSIALNRILIAFTKASLTDTKPMFNGVLISAFTFFRNVYRHGKEPASFEDIEKGVAADINLFLEYFDIYLAHVKGGVNRSGKMPVVVYFPDYKSIPTEIYRPQSPSNQEMLLAYSKFLKKHNRDFGVIKQLEHVVCYAAPTSGLRYPHHDAAVAFKRVAMLPEVSYVAGDPVALISHVPTDLYIAGKIRNIRLLESHTATIKMPQEFASKIIKEPALPFYASLHLALGDGVFINQMISRKEKAKLLEVAEKERWKTRSELDVAQRVISLTCLSANDIRRYDFG